MVFVVEFGRCVPPKHWFSQEGCIISFTFEVEGTLEAGFDELVPRAVGVRLGLGLTLGLALDVSGQCVAFVFVKVGMLFSDPVILDVIVCVGDVLFKLDGIVYKCFLLARMDLGHKRSIKLSQCAFQLVAINAKILLILLQLADNVLSRGHIQSGYQK